LTAEARTITWVAVGALRGAVTRHAAQLGPVADQLLELLKTIQEMVREPGPEIPRLAILATATAATAGENPSLLAALELFRAAMFRWGIVLKR